jgi:glycosyltransferase involved in cell wall biosynthesis
MKKILIIGLTSNIGGIETSIFNMYKKLNKKKYKIDFINRSLKPMAFQEYFIKHGSNVFSITSFYKSKIKYFWELLSILRRNKYDCVYCNFSSARFITPALCSRFYGKSKILIHVHNSNTDKGLPVKIIHNINKKILCMIGDYYISCSKEASNWFYNKKIINSNRHIIVENFIDEKKFVFKEKNMIRMRKKYGIKTGLVIGHVGKYSKCKNQEFLFKIYNCLKEKNIDVKMILVGANYDTTLLKDKNIIFTGLISNVNEVLSGVDVFVFPSLYEGFGISLVEAQMLKIPCLASNTIPKETKVSNCIKYLDLNLGAELWAEEIIKLSKIDRNTIKINKNKFDNLKKIVNLFDYC